MQHTGAAGVARRWRRMACRVGAGTAAFTAGLGLLGCAPSEAEIRSEFADYVKEANACEAASECALATADCPLGCFVAVRAERVESVERKARELVGDYESGGQQCQYDCAIPAGTECVDGRCAARSQ
jgi:hypothetical protein